MKKVQADLETAAPEPRMSGDLPPAEFRAAGHALIDWIAELLEHPERLPVAARARPGEVRAKLPAEAPEAPVSVPAQLEQFQREILPGITHWNHPSFFGYFSTTGSYAGVLSEALIAALNVNMMLWKTSPAATELEALVMDWLRRALGMGDGWFGIHMDSASMSTLVAMAAARERLGLGVREQGLAGRPELPVLTAYCSEHAHSSVDKAAITLGIGHANLRKIPADAEFRMKPEALAHAIAADRAAGRRPFFVSATIGTTSSTSVDPIPALAALCRREGLWLHVDGAYGIGAGLLPECRPLLAGLEDADSWVFNPYKWWFTPMTFSAFYTRHADVLRQAFSLVPEYLRTAEGDSVTNYMDYGVQLGRQWRALKMWMVLNTYGLEGMRARLREHLKMARWLAEQIDADPDFERLAPVPFAVVCFRYRPRKWETLPEAERETRLNALNTTLMERLNATGKLFLSHTALNGRLTLRIAIGHIRTRLEDVEAAWRVIREEAGTMGSNA